MVRRTRRCSLPDWWARPAPPPAPARTRSGHRSASTPSHQGVEGPACRPMGNGPRRSSRRDAPWASWNAPLARPRGAPTPVRPSWSRGTASLALRQTATSRSPATRSGGHGLGSARLAPKQSSAAVRHCGRRASPGSAPLSLTVTRTRSARGRGAPVMTQCLLRNEREEPRCRLPPTAHGHGSAHSSRGPHLAPLAPQPW